MLGFMTGQLHGYTSRHSRTLKFPDSSPTEIMQQSALNSSVFTRSLPRALKIDDRLSFAIAVCVVENQRTNYALFLQIISFLLLFRNMKILW
jgi:hypothetical protein